MVKLSLFVFVYVLIVATRARPNREIQEDEDYVSDIVKKGDITNKESSKTAKADTKKANKKQYVIDAIHHGPYHGGHAWGTTSLWPGHDVFPGHGFAAAPGGGWNGYPSFKSKIPKRENSEIKSSSSPVKRWWPGYSGGWGGWGNGNVGYPGWGSGFGGPGFGSNAGYGYGGYGHGFMRSAIPAPRAEVVANKRWWPGYSGGWGGWGVGNSGYPGWGSGSSHGWANPGPIGIGAGHGFSGHGYYRSGIPEGPEHTFPVRRSFVDGYHPGVYGWGGVAYGGYGAGLDGGPGPYDAPFAGPYAGPFEGHYAHGPMGPWGPGGFYPASGPNAFMGPAQFGPFGNPSGFGPFRRTNVSPRKESKQEENARSRQVIGYHPGCYGWGGVVYPGCDCGDGYGDGGFGCGGGCGGCGGGDCGGCGGGGCGGCGGCGGGCGCRSKITKKQANKDVPAKTRQQIESPTNELGEQSSLFGNTFDGAGATSLGGNDATPVIPGMQSDLTEQIENSKSQFPEYSAQYSTEDSNDPAELIQNFHLNPEGGGGNIGETSNPSSEEGNGFTTMGEMPSKRTNLPKQKGSRATKKQSVAYPIPYGQNVMPLYNTMAHPVVPLQHLAAVPHYPLGYTAALIPQYHPAHNIHVGSPSVNVDVQTTREHVAENPEEKSKGKLRRLVRDLAEVLEERTKKQKKAARTKRQLPPNAFGRQPQRFVVPSSRFYVPNHGVRVYNAGPRYYNPSAGNNVMGQPRNRFTMPRQALLRGVPTQQFQSRAPFTMQQQSAMQAMQRSAMNQFSDPPPLTPRQITRMAGISVPLAIQPGAGLVGINKRGKRTAKKKSKYSNNRKRFFLASPFGGPMLSPAQLAPAFPVTGFAPQLQPPVAHGPFLLPPAAIPFAPSHMAGYPAVFRPVLHQPFTGYPAAAFPEPHAPQGVPYFSGAALPHQGPVPLASPGILAQSIPVARQGVPNQRPSYLMHNWFPPPPMQENQAFTNQESPESSFHPSFNGLPSSMIGGGQQQTQQNFLMQPEQPMQVQPQMRSNLQMQPSAQLQSNSRMPSLQQGLASILQQGFGSKKSAVPNKKTKTNQ